MRSSHLFILALPLSILLHAGLVYWWWQRPPAQPLSLGLAHTVTVDLLAAPAPAPTTAPEQPVQKAPAKTEPPPVPARPAVRKTRPAPVPAPQEAVAPAPASASPVTSPAAEVSPANASAPQPMTAARYDADYLKNPPPAYPPLSRRLGEQGTVLLRVQVSAEGKPVSVVVKQSSGSQRLDKAALEATARWRFVPARQGDQAVMSWVEVPIRFTLAK